MKIACLMRGEPETGEVTYSQQVVNPRFDGHSRYGEYLIYSLFLSIKVKGVDTTTGVWRMETWEPLT